METEITTLIEDLPPEILLNVFRYINVRTLFGKVILTCKYFHQVLTSDGIWKTLFSLKWKKHKTVGDLDYISSWSKVYISFEDIDTFWKPGGTKKLIKKKLTGHIGTVDALHILPSKRIFASGSRDRTVLIWRTSYCYDHNEVSELHQSEVLEAFQHEGWVWAIGSDPNKEGELITSSWGRNVKHWDLNTLKLLNTHKYHPGPILSLSCINQVVTTGCFDKHVRQFDLRSNKVISDLVHHKKSVISLYLNSNYIFSGSDDKTVGVYDIRGGKLLTRLHIDSPALCMNTGDEEGFNFLRVGGKNGSMYVFDTTSGSRFSLLNSLSIWSEQKKVTDICTYRGYLMACSEAGSVRAYTPGRDCSFEMKFEDVHSHSGVTSCCSLDSMMLTGGEDCSVYQWRFYDQ